MLNGLLLLSAGFTTMSLAVAAVNGVLKRSLAKQTNMHRTTVLFILVADHRFLHFERIFKLHYFGFSPQWLALSTEYDLTSF
jgi:plasmid maintenance system antidote protein VapI